MMRKRPAKDEKTVSVEFEVPGSVWAERINLVGDINDWDRESLPLCTIVMKTGTSSWINKDANIAFAIWSMGTIGATTGTPTSMYQERTAPAMQSWSQDHTGILKRRLPQLPEHI